MLCQCGCGEKVIGVSTKNFVDKDHQWRVTKKCECGCGEDVPAKRMYGESAYRFKKDHALIGKPGARLGKGPIASLRGQTAPCACGCGELIVISKGDGKIRKFVKGHQMKGRISKFKGTGKKNSIEKKLCACGCGELIKKYGSHGQENTYKNGHYNRGKPGAWLGKKRSKEMRDKMSIYRANNPTNNSYGKRTEYKGVMFKSKTEALRARQLDAMGLEWLYEEHSLIYYLPDGTKHRYTPDFYIPQLDYYEEVKGYFKDDDKLKMKLVCEQHPQIKIVVISQRQTRN